MIEVAVSIEALDRANAALYAEAGVKEYWIVLGARRQVEVYRRPEAGEYRERLLYVGEEEVVCAALPAIRLSLPALFAEPQALTRARSQRVDQRVGSLRFLVSAGNGA